MSNTITLDSLRATVENKYGSTVIDLGDGEVELVNALRLGKKQRKALAEIAADAELDVEERFGKLISVVAATPGQAKILLDRVDGDVPLLATIIETYTKGTQAGEASPSES
jgi:hypothetical protein